jgi:PAS domain-containing protein
VLVALLVSIVVAAWHAYRGRLKRSADAAANSETRYRAIFERAASGIVLFDPSSRRVLDANPQAQRLVGASLEELRRRDVATIFDTPVSLVPGTETTNRPRAARRRSCAATTSAATWSSRSPISNTARAASTP